MSDRSVLILGVKSDIGLAVAYRFAKAGFDLQFAGRGLDSINTTVSDIELRYRVTVSKHEFDILELTNYEQFIKSLPGLPDVAICAVGLLGEQSESEYDIRAAILVLRSNFEGPANLMGALANEFKKRQSGCLVGISSVAGERGRSTNYIYGSAKAGFTAYLSGLRNRMHPYGVHVVTVLPGFVKTKMTRHLKLPRFLTASPQRVANDIYYAVLKKKDLVYSFRVWRLVMLAIRLTPESIFKRMKL